MITSKQYLDAKRIVEKYESQVLKVEPPYEIDKIYTTKFATGWKFLLKVIETDSKGKIVGFKGIYEDKKYLGLCPLGADRLINE